MKKGLNSESLISIMILSAIFLFTNVIEHNLDVVSLLSEY